MNKKKLSYLVSKQDKKYSISWDNQMKDVEWESFITYTNGVNYQQGITGAFIYKYLGWNVNRLVIKHNNEIIGGVQVFTRKINRFITVAFIPQGPSVQTDSADFNFFLIDCVKEWIKKKRIIYLVWDVNYRLKNFDQILFKSGFYKKIIGLPPTAVLRATSILDLNQDEHKIYQKFSQSRKRNLKKSESYNIEFSMGKREDIPLFVDLMSKLEERHTVNVLFNNEQFFFDLWDSLSPMNTIQLHMASIDNKTICAMLCFGLGDTYFFWQWGWSGQYSESNITHALYWHTIKYAKEKGFSLFDFVEVNPDVATSYLGEDYQEESLKGKNFFGPTINKLRWGGDVIPFPGKLMFVSNRFYLFIIKRVFPILINNKFLIKIRKKYSSRV